MCFPKQLVAAPALRGCLSDSVPRSKADSAHTTIDSAEGFMGTGTGYILGLLQDCRARRDEGPHGIGLVVEAVSKWAVGLLELRKQSAAAEGATSIGMGRI